MKFKNFLIEMTPPLDPVHKKEFTKLGKDVKYNTRYPEIFGDKDRVIIPVSGSVKVELEYDLQRRIQRLHDDNPNAVGAINYDNNTVIIAGKNGKNGKTSEITINDLIKKGIKDEKERKLFLGMWEHSAYRKGPKFDNVQIVISRNPCEIGAMSTNVGWKSCMNLYTGSYNKHTRDDVREGTLVAYLVDVKDKNIDYPIGRILLKPYKDKEGKIALNPGTRTYGYFPEKYLKELNKWLDKQQKGVKGEFHRNPKLYDDDEDDVIYKGVKRVLFKKGDRVRCNGVADGNEDTNGKTGTVMIDQKDKNDDAIAVKFDENVDGHRLSGRGIKVKQGHGWNVNATLLEKIKK